MLDDVVAVVLVKVRVFGRPAVVEEFRERSDFGLVDVVPREPSGVAGDVDGVSVGVWRWLRRAWSCGGRIIGLDGEWRSREVLDRFGSHGL